MADGSHDTDGSRCVQGEIPDGHILTVIKEVQATGEPAQCFLASSQHTIMIHSLSTWSVHMKSKRAHILLPQDLIKEIDAIVGPRRRSAFLVETARDAVRRTKLLRFLEGDTPAWNDADHPELAGGAAAWVRELRQES